MLVAVVLLVAASGSGSAPSTANSRTAANARTTATALPGPTVPSSTAAETTTTAVEQHLVASVAVPLIDVYDALGQEAPTRQLANPTQPRNTPLVFLVREQREDGWLNVLLPVRPNGSTGWIRRSDVSLTRHSYRVLVELGAHKLTVWKGNELFAEEPIAVGTVERPTPPGNYYTAELLEPTGEDALLYGAFAFSLSGFSEVLQSFRGGEPQLAIHGTTDPSSIGSDVSNGCIRLNNEAITRLATTLPIGVPVEVRA